jgi:ribosomal protein S13
VFKGWSARLGAGETVTLEKRHVVKPITTRRYYAGRHRVELQVNGQVVAEAHFTLRIP